MRPGGYNSSNNEENTRNNQSKLRAELNNLYGGRNGFLNNGEIKALIGKYKGNNAMNVKKQAYKKAYTKYMDYMAGEFAQDVIRVIKEKMKSSPICPTGVEGGGRSLGGTLRAVTGGMKAVCGKSGQPKCANSTRQNGRQPRSTAGQQPAKFANGNRSGAPQARSRS